MKIGIRNIQNTVYYGHIEIVDLFNDDGSLANKEFVKIHRFRCKYCKKYIRKFLIQKCMISECPHCKHNISLNNEV